MSSSNTAFDRILIDLVKLLTCTEDVGFDAWYDMVANNCLVKLTAQDIEEAVRVGASRHKLPFELKVYSGDGGDPFYHYHRNCASTSLSMLFQISAENVRMKLPCWNCWRGFQQSEKLTDLVWLISALNVPTCSTFQKWFDRYCANKPKPTSEEVRRAATTEGHLYPPMSMLPRAYCGGGNHFHASSMCSSVGAVEFKEAPRSSFPEFAEALKNLSPCPTCWGLEKINTSASTQQQEQQEQQEQKLQGALKRRRIGRDYTDTEEDSDDGDGAQQESRRERPQLPPSKVVRQTPSRGGKVKFRGRLLEEGQKVSNNDNDRDDDLWQD